MVPNRATHHKCENCFTVSIPQNEKECSSDDFLMMGLQERKTYKFSSRVLRQFCWTDEIRKDVLPNTARSKVHELKIL